MKIGICFGGYCPLHQGHMDLIFRAKKENDLTYVIVCGYTDEPRGLEIGLTPEKRYEIIRDFFRDDRFIKVLLVKDDDLGIDQSMSEENWRIWSNVVSKLIFRCIRKGTPIEITWYVAEKFYEDSLKKVGYNNIICLQKLNLVSGTEIRKNPVKYWRKIMKPFRLYLTHRILITGTASEGKSTLVKDISKYYGTPLIEEYGRTYMEKYGITTDLDLGKQEFLDFLRGQNILIQNACKSKENPGFIISDTDNLVTLMYAREYSKRPEMEKISPEDYKELYNEAKLNIQKWDKIFVLPPYGKFINDGTRYMPQSSLQERMKNFESLMDLIKDFGYLDKVEILQDGYLGNYERLKEYINSLF